MTSTRWSSVSLATKKIIVCWAMGVTQQKYGVPTGP